MTSSGGTRAVQTAVCLQKSPITFCLTFCWKLIWRWDEKKMIWSEGPVWITTCWECCFKMFQPFLFLLGCSGHFFSPMLWGFDHTYLVFLLIPVCRANETIPPYDSSEPFAQDKLHLPFDGRLFSWFFSNIAHDCNPSNGFHLQTLQVAGGCDSLILVMAKREETI